MLIRFCYIEGISTIDTPYFSSQAEQENYMINHIVQDVNTSYYPPHYTNRIIVDTEDINFNTSINYCFFEYNDKYYFYFIDAVEYISEDTIAIDISMDVIQTYYFNIYVQEAFIEREHIKRWYKIGNTWYINRNYIRENVSKGEFEVQDKYKYEDCDDNRLWLVIKVYDSSAALQKYSSRVYYSPLKYIDVPYGYFVLPTKINKIRYKGTNGTQTFDVDYNRIVKILTDNKVIDFYVLKRNPYSHNTTISTEQGVVIYDISQTTEVSDIYDQLFVRPVDTLVNYDDVYYSMTNVNRRFVDVNTGTHPINRNTSITRTLTFVDEYETALMDENYYRLTFGDVTNACVFPMHYTDVVTYKCQVLYDFDNGANVYYITDTSTNADYLVNKYDIAESSNVKLTMQLLNDAYKSYAANNASRWLVAGIKTTKNFISAFAGALGSTSTSSSKTSSNFSSQYMKGGVVTGERFSHKSGTSGNVREYNSGNVVSGAVEGISPLVDQAMTDVNARMSPSSTRNTGTAITDILSLHLYTYKTIAKVRDYYQCAMYYQRYGYKVDRFISACSNIFDEVRHRYYYNILKLSDSNIHLHNVIEDEQNVSLVKERLEKGIRLWEMYHQITVSVSGRNEEGASVVDVNTNIPMRRIKAGTVPVITVVNDDEYEFVRYYYSNIRPAQNLIVVVNSLVSGGQHDVELTIKYIPADSEGVIGLYQYENVESDFIE